MKCIFCKGDSSASKSIEHIIPESLGNIDHTLPPGVVCDSCNNYFSVKIEFQVVHAFRWFRGTMNVPNKKGRQPAFESNETPKPPEYRLMSRFIGKIGLEALASRLLNIPGWNEEITDKRGLDELREYVRFDRGDQDWPFLSRALYPFDSIFFDATEQFEILHEYDLLYTPTFELYIVLAIFGAEFTLNLGGPYLEGYQKWLKENNFQSPLYCKKDKIYQN